MHSTESEERYATIECPWCDSLVRRGVRVCVGCNADVVYGVTKREAARALKLGLVLGVALSFVIDRLVGGFSTMNAALTTAVLVAVASSAGSALVLFFVRRGKPRFIRRTAL